MKNNLIVATFFFLSTCVNAQTTQIKDLSNSVGSWKGKLTYLDYTSGNPFTMLANISISFTNDNKGYIMDYAYPKEPQANSKDTIFLIGNNFGKDKIVEFHKTKNGNFTLVTEYDGFDGNDEKKATIRHTYRLHFNSFSITKHVKFDNTVQWIKRNEYLLNRAKN